MIRKIIKYILIGGVILFVIAVLNSDNSGTPSTESSKERSQERLLAEDNPDISSKEQRINIPGWTDSPYITRDGNELYFMYSRYNFFPIFSGGQPTLQMPTKAGHHNNDTNPWDDSDLYVARRNADGSWGVPENLSFNDTGSGCCAMIVEGPPFRIYYQNGAEGNFTDIVYREKTGTQWSSEINLDMKVNSTEMEDNPHVSADQNHLWFTSDRPGGLGGKDIWYSKRVNGEWTEAVNPGAPLNSATDEDQIWVSDIDGTVYFNRDGVYQSQWNGATFSEPKRVTIDAPTPINAEISVTDDGEMFFANLDPTTGRIRIYSATQKGNGTWGNVTPVD